MRVLHVASEVAPWSQTGGLGMVAGSLAPALAAAGAEVSVVTPLYRGIAARAAERGESLVDAGIDVSVELEGRAIPGRFLRTRAGGARVYFLDCPLLFDRAGLYGEAGVDYPDNPFRFAFLCRAAATAGELLCDGRPDVVHGHDWQTGLVPVYLSQTGHRPRAVFTIHNLAFQGLVPKHLVPALGISWDGFLADGFEFWDKVSYLKAGCSFSDAITTVSPTYAREITTPPFGCGLDGFFRKWGCRGILNGIDVDAWDPARDPSIAARFTVADLSGKAACRAALEREVGLPPGGLLLGVVSRLTEQKGLDLVVALVDQLAALDARLVVLGSGDHELEARLAEMASAAPDRVALRVRFDEALAHRIFAGVDALLMPSRFEPCGLAQMQAMRYGTLPIVNPVGGLYDTVTDGADGFHMRAATAAGLSEAVARAAALKRDRARWSRAVTTAMARDWSWEQPAARYLELYRRLLGTSSPS